MKLSCPIVRDLLPLYAENLASAESRDAVETHLQDCPACRKLLADMKTDFGASTVTETRPLLRIRRILRLRWLRGALLAAMLALAVAFCIAEVQTRPYYLPCPHIIKVFDNKAGLYFVADVECDSWVSYVTPDPDGGYIIFLSFMNTRHANSRTDMKDEPHFLVKWGETAERNRVFQKSDIRAVYYSNNDGMTDAKLLWGTPVADGVQELPRLALTYYLLLAAVLAILFGLLALVFRKKPVSRVFLCIALAPLAFCAAVLATRGFETATYSLTQELPLIGWASLALYAAALLGLSLVWDKKA